jgi:methanethiol oxidase
MARITPDPTFYASAREATAAPPETLGYVVTLNPSAALGNGADGRGDALCVIDLEPRSSTYGQVVGRLELPNTGDELHHFGWNACSSALCPWAPHPHLERRYFVINGLRSSRSYIVDVKADPRNPKLEKVIEPDELARKSGYSRTHTSHCGPEGIYIGALGNPDGDGPGGIVLLDHESFDVKGAWEKDRGPQHLSYDFWWHLGHNTMITSEWGTPNMVEGGVNPEILLSNGYGHQLHVWDLDARAHKQTIDLGAEQQMVLELRPSHDPTKAYGFVCVVVSTADLSASIWLWSRQDNGGFGARKVISIPAEPADEDQLPDALKPFKAVPPLVTDISLSVDDHYLFVSCWGTGELKRYDVTDPANPVEAGSVRIGGIVGRSPHPAAGSVTGGPQMVETSRDGRRVYLTNSLYASWDAQFYPDGIHGWLVKLDSEPGGDFRLDPDFFVAFSKEERPHQVRLEGGDASSDSYCFPNE